MNTSRGTNENRMQSAREHVEGTLRDRVDRARDVVENVRERAEIAFRDRPYLVPVAAGAVGLGVGMLLGSRIMRFLLFTAVGTVVSETLGGEIRRIASDFMHEMQNRLEEGREEPERRPAE